MCLYVDDIIYMGSNESIVEEFKLGMMRSFEMTDLGLLHYFLGLEIKQSSDGVFLCQKKYAEDLLNSFHMMHCKPALTPMNTNEKLQMDDGTEATDARRYRGLVGRLIYLPHTRPYIAFSVGIVSRFMTAPTRHHFGAARRILKYIACTYDYGVWYTWSDSLKLHGFTDSDWAGSIDDRKSTSGNVFLLGSNAITWSSRKQESVALSTTEAEYIAATSTACQAVWLRRMLSDLSMVQKESTTIYCDNKSTIAIAKNPTLHRRTKHIDIRLHFIRSLISDGTITLKHCSTENQMADIFTKPLLVQKHTYLRNLLNVHSYQSRDDVENVLETTRVAVNLSDRASGQDSVLEAIIYLHNYLSSGCHVLRGCMFRYYQLSVVD